jgi:hypothetical protein
MLGPSRTTGVGEVEQQTGDYVVVAIMGTQAWNPHEVAARIVTRKSEWVLHSHRVPGKLLVGSLKAARSPQKHGVT